MSWCRQQMAARAADELTDVLYVNLGIGLPTLVPNYVADDVALVLSRRTASSESAPIQPRTPSTLVCGMALGHADEKALVNTLETPREPVDTFAKLGESRSLGSVAGSRAAAHARWKPTRLGKQPRERTEFRSSTDGMELGEGV